MDGTAPETNWYTDDFSGTWPTATLSALPVPQSISAYYCANFDVLSIQAYATVHTSIRTRGGYALYINGKEMTRARLPAGDLTYQTQPTEESESLSAWVANTNFAYAEIRNTDNLICVELHTMTAPSTSEFYITLSFNAAVTDLVYDGTLSASHEGLYNGLYDERYYNVADKDTSTKLYIESTYICYSYEHAWVTYTFDDDRKEYSNEFYIYSGNMVNRRPYQMQVQGLGDDGNWVVIQQFYTQGTWGSSSSPTAKTLSFTNTQAYNAYRLEFWGCESEGIELAEWYIRTTATVTICQA